MSNQALPQKSRQMLDSYLDRCQNLGLILDKFAPWGPTERGGWDLVMRSTVRRSGIKTLSGGEAKGIWLSTTRTKLNGESPTLFDVPRTDISLMHAKQKRWADMVYGSDGVVFSIRTAERLVAGLGASHVLETALTLDRNTGLPYLPGSTVKGLTRSAALIAVANELNVSLDDKTPDGKEPLLNAIAEILISQPREKLYSELEKIVAVPEDARVYIDWFRFILGSQSEAGAICFLDAIYAGQKEPIYVTDVMTPHYVNYYTENGGRPPAEDDNPNPVSFITVDKRNRFAFGLIPRPSAFTTFPNKEQADRISDAFDITYNWLVYALSRLGAGGKTAAGYGFFSRNSITMNPELGGA